MGIEITQEVRARVMAMAGRRCECTGENCRHHLRGARCKRGLRGDQWKIYWRSESGGMTRQNIEAWCLECFSNNFSVPTERVALVTADLARYAELESEDYRRAVTLRSVLRDSADRVARDGRGRVVDTIPDELIIEFASARDALNGARSLWGAFREWTARLDLTTPEVHEGIHCGDIRRWRDGTLAGQAIDVASRIRRLAPPGRIVVSDPVVSELGSGDGMEPVPEERLAELPDIRACWAIPLPDTN